MARNELINHDDKMGRALEKSFRKAVAESKAHGYVSITDRPANKSIKVSGLDAARHDAKVRISRSHLKKSAKKSA